MPAPVTNSEAIAKACQAIKDVRVSRAATQHAIAQSRKSLVETHALLLALRAELFGVHQPCRPTSIAAKTVARRSSAPKPSPSMKR
jgi:hypothetical protein